MLAVELNAATDNPLIFPDVVVADADARATGHGHVISGGNFHGEPVALALDFAKLALAELGSISERRIALLLDANLNGGLPAFLASDSGLETGYMLLQYTAAALASENKTPRPPGVGRLHPDEREPGGPRLDGPDRRAAWPRHVLAARRADRRDRAAVRGARARPPDLAMLPGDLAGRAGRRAAHAAIRECAAVGRGDREPGAGPRGRRRRLVREGRARPALAVAGPTTSASDLAADVTVRILDVTDEAGFRRMPPCADPGFDHRTCDYWEDDRRGSKASRLSWLEPTPPPAAGAGTAVQPIRAGVERSEGQPIRSTRPPGVG